MAGVFNGSTSYLYTSGSLVGSTPTYPCLLSCWVKTDITNAYIALGLGDNVSATYDLMELQTRGDQAGDPVYALSAANAGGTVNAEKTGLTTDWTFAAAYFQADNVRYAYIGSSVGTVESTQKTTSGLVHASIGARYWDSAPNSFLSGKIAEVIIANGFSTGNIGSIINKLAANQTPISIQELNTFIKVYQPLRNGLNDLGFIGPNWTNTAVTFVGDHPTVNLYRPQIITL